MGDRPVARRGVQPVLVLVAALALVLVATGCRIMPGRTYTGEGTYYLGDGSGNCSYPAGGSVLYAAMNEADYEMSKACGAYIEATGPKGTVTVRIVDRCPECAPGDIDFSPEAFDKIAERRAGRVPISWHLVSAPASVTTMQFVVKDGSNPWWIGIQVRNHATVLSGVEALVNGSWVELERQQYNYFLAPGGLGNGPFTVRVTDLYGEQLVTSGLTLSPTVVQSSNLQFTRH